MSSVGSQKVIKMNVINSIHIKIMHFTLKISNVAYLIITIQLVQVRADRIPNNTL